MPQPRPRKPLSLLLAAVLWAAAAIVTTAASAAPEDADARALYSQGTAAFGLGQYAEAARLFESAFHAHPEGSLLFNAAQAHRLAGAQARALELYRNYLRLYPKGPYAAQAKRKITEIEQAPAAPAPTPAPTGPVTAAPVTAPPVAAPQRGAADPSPRVSPIAAGGAACATTTAMFGFDATLPPIEVAKGDGRAFSDPALDTTRAFCGRGSLRVRATFVLTGTRTKSGVLPLQSGDAYIKLPAKVDLTNRTLTAHLFVDGPADVPFGAQVAAVNKGAWVNGASLLNQKTGSWITVRHTFGADNRLYLGGSSKVNEVDAVVILMWAAGNKAQRTWTGTVYIDDIDWR